MKRLLSCVALILLGWHPISAVAVDYFVDAVAGNDAFSGTSPAVQNGGTVGPWRTLTKVNAAPLQPDDAVWFRCGHSWRGNLRVASSPDPSRPITYSRFGSDCTDANKPTITTAAEVTGWQPYSGNIYVANTWFRVYQLFADGVALRLAQYPNVDYQAQPSARGMMVTDQNPPGPDPRTVITDTELAAIADQDLIGAGVHVRLNDFTINDRAVGAFDPVNLQITLTQPAQWSIIKNWGYYLDNKLWMLDEPGEFFFDGSNPANMKVYVWMPDGGAPGSRVVGATNAYGIDATGATNVIIRAMRVDKTGVGIALSSSTNVVVRSCEISDSYYRGILANVARDGTIDNCTVRRSVREGIDTGTSTNFKILNNRVIDSGVIGSPVQSRGAIASYSSGIAINNNYVLNSGYHGIAFGRTSEVINNRVENVCLVLNDCGGLYTGTSGSSLPNNSVVMTNIINGVYGNRNGRDPNPVHDVTPGIYLDFRTNGVYVARNTVSKAEWGIFAHAASANAIVDNTFYDNKTHAINIKEYSSVRITSPNVIRRNRIFALGSGIPIVLFPAVDDITGLATWDSNRYSALYADNSATLAIAKSSVFLNGQWSDRFFTLQEWQQAGQDTSGTVFDDFSIAPFAYQPVNGVNLLSNGTFDSNTAGWIGWATQGDASLAWSSNCIAPGCAALTAGGLSSSGSLVSGAFPIEPGKTYVVRLRNRSGQQAFTSVVLALMAGPRSYDLFQGWFGVTASDTWRDHTLLFSVPSDLVLQPGDLGGRVDFQAPPNHTLYLDNVRLEEVTSTANTPEDDSILLVNSADFSAAITCPDETSEPAKCTEYVYFDDGSPVTWPVTLAARRSSIVVWAGNPFRNQ